MSRLLVAGESQGQIRSRGGDWERSLAQSLPHLPYGLAHLTQGLSGEEGRLAGGEQGGDEARQVRVLGRRELWTKLILNRTWL